MDAVRWVTGKSWLDFCGKKERKIVTLLLRTTKAREFPYVILRPFRFITYRPFIIPRYPQWTKLAGRRTSENTQASGPQVERIKGIRSFRTRRRFALPECFCSSLQLGALNTQDRKMHWATNKPTWATDFRRLRDTFWSAAGRQKLKQLDDNSGSVND